MERPGVDHERWHGFDIFGSLDPSGRLRLKYDCTVEREGEEQFTFIGRLDRYKALSMAGGEDRLEATMKELAFERAHAIIDLRTFEVGKTIERSLDVPREAETKEISDLELRRKLLEVLYTIRREHPRTYKTKAIDIDGISMELGISEDTYYFTVDYLDGKGLLEKPTWGIERERYSQVSITEEGMDAYERGLLVGPVVEELVAETREFVDSELERLCPAAAKKLAQTYSDVVEGSTELRWSQVAYACREILKDFIDAICDPEFLGAEIDLPDRSKTKNKIRAALKARIPKVGKTEARLFEALAGYIDDYFDKLNDYIQKRVHPGRQAQVESESAKRCLIYTYLLIGDVLFLLS